MAVFARLACGLWEEFGQVATHAGDAVKMNLIAILTHRTVCTTGTGQSLARITAEPQCAEARQTTLSVLFTFISKAITSSAHLLVTRTILIPGTFAVFAAGRNDFALTILRTTLTVITVLILNARKRNRTRIHGSGRRWARAGEQRQ
jgi:hypothetical protein|tara:strand:- start:966 stop:1406 length:441 start_codon:yes stop_codon:yes gene_type:complete